MSMSAHQHQESMHIETRNEKRPTSARGKERNQMLPTKMVCFVIASILILVCTQAVEGASPLNNSNRKNMNNFSFHKIHGIDKFHSRFTSKMNNSMTRNGRNNRRHNQKTTKYKLFVTNPRLVGGFAAASIPTRAIRNPIEGYHNKQGGQGNRQRQGQVQRQSRNKGINQGRTSTARKAFFGDAVDDKKRKDARSGHGNGHGHSSGRENGNINTDPYSLNRNYQPRPASSHQNAYRGGGGGSPSPGSNSAVRDENGERKGGLVMSSSVSADNMMGRNRVGVNSIIQGIHSIQEKIQNMDVAYAGIVVTYVCTQIAITLPVILIPVIAADPYAAGAIIPEAASSISSAAFVGQIVSISVLGAGVGKLINGFICKAIGGRVSGSIYMFGLAAFSLLLSTTSSYHSVAIAGMEFCASIMWTAVSVLMANKFENDPDPKKFTAAITSLSLASTSGTLIAKTFGGALLSMFHWRQVCFFATFAALLGSAVLFFTVNDTVNSGSQTRERSNTRLRITNDGGSRKIQSSKSMVISKSGSKEMDDSNENGLAGIISSISTVMTNPLFWMVGFSHFCSFIVRSSDKVLGTFIFAATNLPRSLCGPLTTSVTLGFIGGLVSGREINDLETIGEKRTFVAKRYGLAALSAVGLALCSNENAISILGQYGLAGAITVFSGLLAAMVGFQFYQFIPKYATSFGQNKAVYISLTDACAFLLLSPFWSTISGIVASSETSGWAISWLIIAGFMAMGGAVMTSLLPTVLRLEGYDQGQNKKKL